MMSEGDSVIDTRFVQQVFTESMLNPNNVDLARGKLQFDDPRCSIQQDPPEQRVFSNGFIWAYRSHQATLLRITVAQEDSNGQEEGFEAQCNATRKCGNFQRGDIVKKVKTMRVWPTIWYFLSDSMQKARCSSDPEALKAQVCRLIHRSTKRLTR